MSRRPPPPLEVRLAADEFDRHAHFAVRHAVFVDEQGIFPAHDRDAHDADALLVVAAVGPLVVGAVRIYPLPEPGVWKGDRLAVLPEARRRRAGGPLVRFAVRTAGEHGGSVMRARVQAANVPFFMHLGWRRVGDPADHLGLSHQDMEIPLQGAHAEAAAPAPG